MSANGENVRLGRVKAARLNGCALIVVRSEGAELLTGKPAILAAVR